jgi:serine/threonine protein kinase
VHADVKLTNILVRVPDQLRPVIWLCDFGISRSVDEARRVTWLVGTTDYAAPEILLRKGFDQKVDVWAFGVTLYRLLCGSFPFSVRAGPIDWTPKFHEDPWTTISLRCKIFVESLLKRLPDKRLSAVDALRDHWLRPVVKPINPVKDGFPLDGEAMSPLQL